MKFGDHPRRQGVMVELIVPGEVTPECSRSKRFNHRGTPTFGRP